MKKTELKNCPQWLLDAETVNEDVDFDRYGILIWRGGYFLGGEFRGGEFRGGEFLGGKFRGGEFRGGYFLGEAITKAPIFIFNIGKWSASITSKMMAIGCQHHSHEDWRNFTDDQISDMAYGAMEFWQKNKDFLLMICASEVSNKP